MSTITPRQVHIPDWKYSCIDCGQCCCDWHVELSQDDLDRLNALAWPAEEAIPKKRVIRMAGNDYIAHRHDGVCIYYDAKMKNCRIHARFGFDAKPLGCKIYPFSIAPTFEGHCSMIGRFDCPAVRKKTGKSMRSYTGSVKAYATEMQLRGGFDELDLEGLKPAKAEKLVDALIRHVFDNKVLTTGAKMVAAQIAAARLESLGTIFINDVDLKEILPSFFNRITEDLKTIKIRRLGAMEQVRFLSLLTAFIRRDEEAIGGGMSSRFSRMTAMCKLLAGQINLRRFGREHPDFAMKRKDFFGTKIDAPADMPLDLMFALMRLRLESYQFFGKAAYNRSFFFGLKALFMQMPLMLALAKWHAMARGGVCRVNEEDVAYAVGAIDHAYGRSALLGLRFMNTLQRQVCDQDAHTRLVEELICPVSMR